MKKLLAILLTLAMVLSMGLCAYADDETEEASAPIFAEFPINEEYALWTVVEYTIEAIEADLVCTICTNEDMNEFYLETNFYGDDQMILASFDGENYEILKDKTGFLSGDAPAILDIARENDTWLVMPEFEPNEEYAYFTVTEYTIEAIEADLVCTISTNEEQNEFYLECNFYGDDQMILATFDGENYEILKDKTGFLSGDAPAILDTALATNLWVPVG